jgi:hypothetical protein
MFGKDANGHDRHRGLGLIRRSCRLLAPAWLLTTAKKSKCEESEEYSMAHVPPPEGCDIFTTRTPPSVPGRT